jgi:hypothetical protein
MRKPLQIKKLCAVNYLNFHTIILKKQILEHLTNEGYSNMLYLDLWLYEFSSFNRWLILNLSKCCNGSGRVAVCELSKYKSNIPFSILFTEVV